MMKEPIFLCQNCGALMFCFHEMIQHLALGCENDIYECLHCGAFFVKSEVEAIVSHMKENHPKEFAVAQARYAGSRGMN